MGRREGNGWDPEWPAPSCSASSAPEEFSSPHLQMKLWFHYCPVSYSQWWSKKCTAVKIWEIFKHWKILNPNWSAWTFKNLFINPKTDIFRNRGWFYLSAKKCCNRWKFFHWLWRTPGRGWSRPQRCTCRTWRPRCSLRKRTQLPDSLVSQCKSEK